MDVANHIYSVEFDAEPDTIEWREEWLDWRLLGLGSSDIAAAATGDYGGAYRVVAERIGVETPKSEEIDAGDAERGHSWERPLADMIHASQGYHVGAEQMACEHPDDDRWRATIDGLLMTSPEMPLAQIREGFEIKTRRIGKATWKWAYWVAQCRWHMFVTGCRRWLLVVATIDDEVDPETGDLLEPRVTDVRFKWIYWDEEAERELVDLAEWIWGHVERGELPEPLDSYALPWVTSATSTPGEKGAGADIDDLGDTVALWEEMKAQSKDAKEAADTARAQIQARMGEGREAHTKGDRHGNVWRVRYGERHTQWTDQSFENLRAIHERHTASCPEDCTVHRPDLLAQVLDRAETVTRVNKDVVAAIFGEDVVEQFKVSLPRRTLTSKRIIVNDDDDQETPKS